MARKILALLFTLAISTFVLAEGTRTWEQSRFEDLVKGTAKGVALRSAGGLELAPAFKGLATTPSTYLWSIASDSAGNVYAAAGSPARVYLITPDGKVTTIFEPGELQVQSLVVGKNNVLYAATAPDGKVYRIAPNVSAPKPAESQPVTPSRPSAAKGGELQSGSSSHPNTSKEGESRAGAQKPTANLGPTETSGFSTTPYFEPGTKYIWDLVLDNAGNLYVATGDHGEIFKVAPNGQSSLFFKSDEVHIRVLALDPKGNLIAGSDGSGLIYRIAPNGNAFVLYSAPKKEITALAIDSSGNIYAAAAGEKRPGPSGPLNLSPGPQGAAPSGGAQPAMGITLGASSSGQQPSAGMSAFPAPGVGASGGSEIYRIAPDGAPTRLWSSREDLVYALAFDQHGRLLAGSGNRGHIFAIDGLDEFSDLLKAPASQITAFASAPGGGLYASSSNLGKIFLLGPGVESEGTYESDVYDAHVFSRWGRSSLRSTGNVEVFARSGNVDNPDRNWSPWMRIDFATGAEMNVPPARFVQWKAVLREETVAPRVDSVLLYYLPKNIAPVVDDVIAQPGFRYSAVPRQPGSEPSPPPPPVRDRDSIGIRWTAHDDNDDQLIYTVLYRGDGESRWLMLKDDLSDRFYSFDASLLPDGGYTVKVVASDAPSHSPGDALTAERESGRFEVDTTPPVIENLTAARESKHIHVRFRAVDSYSPVKRAEYSIDGGDWQFVEPVGQIADSRTEDYDFQAPIPPTSTSAGTGSDHVVVVRAYDRFENLVTSKVVLHGR